MNTRQLRYFVAIVEQGSFSRAASTLRIAQPALSQHIFNLEDELDTALLIRLPRGVAPTSAGKVLYEHAKKINSQLKRAADDVRMEAKTPRGEVTVVLPPMLGLHVAPRLLERVAKQYPEVSLNILEALGLDALTLVESGRADFGVMSSDGAFPTVQHRILYHEPMFCVQRRENGTEETIGDEASIRFLEVTKLPLVLSQNQHTARAMAEAAASQLERSLNVRVTSESLQLRMSYILSGLTAGILPWSTFYLYWRRGEVRARRIVEPELIRTVAVIWPNNFPLNAATQMVMDNIVQLCHELQASGIIRTTSTP